MEIKDKSDWIINITPIAQDEFKATVINFKKKAEYEVGKYNSRAAATDAAIMRAEQLQHR